MTSWNPPCWSQIPPSTQQWHLDELKNGILLGTHSLTNLLSSNPPTNQRRCITFGRIIDNPSQIIDILTAHESCSRLHARIAFSSSGIPYLKDLGSGNGTFVNNRQLPPEACGKWECTEKKKVKDEVRGSRGVVLYPGDAIRFGCSTRIFVLEGPEEFERGAMSDKRTVVSGTGSDSNDVVATNDDADNVVETKEEVCTWGMSTDDDDEQQDEQQLQQSSSATSQSNNNNKTNLPSIDTFFSTPSTNYTISNTLQQLYNQYQSKSYKLDTISTESKRISQKEEMGVELTDGQRNQLAKNRDKLTALEASMKELKEKIEEGMCLAIYGKVLNNRHSSQRSKRDVGYGRDGEEDDVDDFFDRTATASLSSKRHRHNDHEEGEVDDEEEVESESSLVQKWKVLIQSYSKQQAVLSSKMKQCDKLQRQIDNVAAGDDDEEEEDVFFLQNDLNLVMEDVKKAMCRLEDIEHDLKGVERLLKIVNQKLSWDRELGLIGTDLRNDAEKTKCNELEADNTATNVSNEQDESIMTMPPPPQTAAGIPASTNSFDMPPPPMMLTTAATTSALTSFDMMPPPPPKMTIDATESTSDAPETRVITEHPINPDRETPQEKQVQSPPPPQKKKRQLGPMRPPPTTSAGTQGTLAALQQFTSSQHSNEESSHTHHAKKQKKSKTLFDPRKDEWNAPSDQDGSGRTSLHDKFKGRY